MDIAQSASAPPPPWRIQEKWQGVVTSGDRGFQAVPDVLLRGQAAMKLSDGELVVLLNILMHWWEPEKWPYPRPSAIATRMGVKPRTVERHIKKLEEKGLFVRLASEDQEGLTVRKFDLSGLLEMLKQYAEWQEGARA